MTSSKAPTRLIHAPTHCDPTRYWCSIAQPFLHTIKDRIAPKPPTLACLCCCNAAGSCPNSAESGTCSFMIVLVQEQPRCHSTPT